MPTTRTTLCWLFLALLPCMGMDCEPDPPCVGEYQGGLSLQPGAAQWLADADSLCFVNSNGFRAVLDRVAPGTSPDSVPLAAIAQPPTSYKINELISAGVNCGTYFQAALLDQQYQGRNLNLHLRLSLFKDLAAGGVYGTYQSLTRAEADTLPDLLVVLFNQQYLAVFPAATRPSRQPRTIPLGTVVYLDSVQLAGRMFRQVYRLSQPSYPQPPGLQPTHPESFFVRPGQGLVGFVYNNREEWARL